MSEGTFKFRDDDTLNNSIQFFNRDKTEMLRITEDSFYVRGVKVEQNEAEGRIVYENFKLWLEDTNKDRQ